jgi:SAM-dependent methyltransferase
MSSMKPPFISDKPEKSDESDKRDEAPKIPVFSERDPNSPVFWNERFTQDFMPWDSRGAPAPFVAFANHSERCEVLIPGCGSAYEAAWLAERRWPVTAIDFSTAALAAARLQLGEHAAVARLADFFTFVPERAPQWIYERAFLCALAPGRRAEYARRMAELLAPGGILAGFFFLGATDKGPPFAIDEDLLDDLLAPHFDLIDDRPVADSLPAFEGRERWLTWRRRGAMG